MTLNDNVLKLIGSVIILFLIVAFMPSIYNEVTDLENETINQTYINESGEEDTREVNVAPNWFITVISVIIGAGLIFIAWRTYNN